MLNRPTAEIADVAGLLLLGSLAAIRLTALPVFEDEGSQLHLIWRIVQAGEWLQPLGDGKPLEAWLMVPLVGLGPEPIALIRGLHVLSGMLGAVLTYRLALQVSNRSAALTSGALFAICPFVVYLQRLALSDIFMCTAGIWAHLRLIRLIRSPTWTNSAWLATALSLAALCKLPVGFVFLLSMPLALALLPASERRALLQPPAMTRLAAAHAPAVALAAVIAVVALIRARHGHPPGFGLADLLGLGLGKYTGITAAIGVPRPDLLTELTAQLSWPVVAIGCIGLVASAFQQDWRRRWLIAIGALPMLAIGLLTHFWFSRYLLFTLPPLIIAAVCGWKGLALRAGRLRQPVQIGVLGICVGFMGHQSALIILDPAAARWSPLDRFQYFEGWSSGYGYPEAAKFVLDSPEAPPMIYSLDGHSAYQLLTYLPAAWIGRVKPIIYGHDGELLRSEDARLENLFSQTPVWIIISEQLLQGYMDSSFGPRHSDQINLRQIAEFDKPGSRARLGIYAVSRR
jgi:4-amino-4-deoxy-L-arabinose transferase-like glycosyltransferase